MSNEEKTLKQIFPSQEVQTKFVNMVVSNKPSGWGRKSIAPYYKAVYGSQMKADVDRMMANKSVLIYRYSVWCNSPGSMSHQTLYNRVNQSLRYVLENMDPSGKYKAWYETVRVSREPGLGVQIKYIEGLDAEKAGTFSGEEVAPEMINKPKWKDELDTWLENNEDHTPFCREKLMLDEGEVKRLKEELSGITNIMCSITSNSVKIIKTGENNLC